MKFRFYGDAKRDYLYIIYYILMIFTIKYLKIAGKIIQISHKVTLIYGLYLQHFKFEELHHLHSVLMYFHRRL